MDMWITRILAVFVYMIIINYKLMRNDQRIDTLEKRLTTLCRPERDDRPAPEDPAVTTRLRPSARRCSKCRETGHTVRTCGN